MKEYKNDQLIVYWTPELCSHVAKCINNLPQVFNLKARPWVNINGAGPEEIIKVIDTCPTGALRYSLPEGSSVDPAKAAGVGNINYEKSHPAIVTIRVIANGPLLTEGPVVVVDQNCKKLKEGSKMALCRCGLTGNRPFCDGTHSKKGWVVDD